LGANGCATCGCGQCQVNGFITLNDQIIGDGDGDSFAGFTVGKVNDDGGSVEVSRSGGGASAGGEGNTDGTIAATSAEDGDVAGSTVFVDGVGAGAEGESAGGDSRVIIGDRGGAGGGA
jgi:hypothetical protein